MAKKSDKRRQDARRRKAARRKAKRASSSGSAARRAAPHALLRVAGSWPLYEAWLPKSWQEPGEIIQILIARQSEQGDVALGAFLVDLGCLGVKSAFGRVLDRGEYHQIRDESRERQDMIKTTDLDLLAKIIREALAYAEEFGFKPDPDYRDAMLVLGDADPDASDVEIPLGREGKPFFVAGPYDNVDAIMNRLLRKCGPGGFDYLVPLMPPDLDPQDWED